MQHYMCSTTKFSVHGSAFDALKLFMEYDDYTLAHKPVTSLPIHDDLKSEFALPAH